MIKKLFFSISIQSIGTLSSFALVWLITHYLGLEKQGEFALFKSWIDLWIVIGCFGLPQGFTYAINKLKVSSYSLKKFTTYYPLVVLMITTITSYIWFNFFNQTITLSFLQYIFIGIAIAGLVGHALLKGIFLTQNDDNLYAIVCILPAVALFTLVIVQMIISKNVSFSISYLLSGILSFSILFPLVKVVNKTVEKTIPWKKIISDGQSVFLQGMAITLLPVCTYWLMHEFNMTQKEIGGFNIAMYFYLAIALPLNMISPIFFNRWSKMNDIFLIKQELKKFILIGLLIIPFSVLLSFIIRPIAYVLFGEEISFAISTIQIFLLSGVIIYLNNILGCVNFSFGRFKINSLFYIIKSFLIIIFVFIALKFLNTNITNIALSWILGDISLFIALTISIQRLFKNKGTSK